MSDQTEQTVPSTQAAAPKAVSWLDKIRAAKEHQVATNTAPINNVPITVVVAPEITSGKQTGDGTTMVDTTHTLFDIPEAEKGTLVLDTNAFIKGFDNFLQTADVYVTTAAVIQECRDRRTRDFLDRLPVSIEILEPTTESLKKVISVAEKTGDLGMLSRTDLHLCALALDVARQRKALQAEITPAAPSVNSSLVEVSSDDDDEDDEDQDEEESETSSDDGNWLDESSDDNDDDDATGGVDKQNQKQKSNNKNKNNKDKKEKKESEQRQQQQQEAKKKSAPPTSNLPGWGEFDDDWSAPSQASQQTAPGQLSKNQQKKLAKLQQQQQQQGSASTGESTTTTTASEATKQNSDGDANQPIASTTQVQELARVKQASAFRGGFSCVTSDFPMQNVLLHCGVPVVGTNGQCIRELRVWVLRCHACTAIVHDTLRQFCPDCGSGDTLKRVHYVVNEKGEKHLFVNFRHKINTRGTVFNLSKPRGGRKGTNKTLVLREDQLRNCGKVDARERFLKQQRENFTGGFGGVNDDGDDDDGLSGFGERDSKNGRRDGNFLMNKSSYTRKNVNEARKVRASRKR